MPSPHGLHSQAVVVHAQHTAPRHAVMVRPRRLPRLALAAVARAADQCARHVAIPCLRPPLLLLPSQTLPGL